MKKVCIYIAGFCSLIAMFSTCYYLSYKNALNKFNQNAAEQKNEMLSQQIGNKNIDSDEKDAVQVDTNKKDTITPNTAYILENYDIKTDKKIQSQLNVPEYLIGLTREGIIEYINNYMLDIPLNEYQQGLVAYELVSFSTDKVVLRKTYNSDVIQYQYFAVVLDGNVVVYYSDKKTVYEYTGILVSELPEEEQIKLNYGIYIKDQEELYSILENYSS
jgi:hypothetical protein